MQNEKPSLKADKRKKTVITCAVIGLLVFGVAFYILVDSWLDSVSKINSTETSHIDANEPTVKIEINKPRTRVLQSIPSALYLIANKELTQLEMLNEIADKFDEFYKEGYLFDSDVEIYTGKIMDNYSSSDYSGYVITNIDKTYYPSARYTAGYYESPFLTEQESIVITYRVDEMVIIQGTKSK